MSTTTRAVKSLSQLGPLMQMAYVPRDFDAALKYWTETMGVGPFFLIENVRLENLRYKGVPTTAPFDMALAYWGDVQVELIRPLDGTPSISSHWLAEGLEGLHHTCVLVDDMVAARALCEAVGAVVLQEGDVPGGGSVIYVDTGGGQGTMLEILKPAPGSDGLFAMMKQAAADWDGQNPVRKLG